MLWSKEAERRRARRELDQDGFEKLLAAIQGRAEQLGWQPVVGAPEQAVELNCIDCYRDGGCREHFQPAEN